MKARVRELLDAARRIEAVKESLPPVTYQSRKLIPGAVGYLYAVSWDMDHTHSPVKIGVTSRPAARFDHLKTSSPFPLITHGIWILPPGDMRVHESEIHEQLQSHWIKGEWFEKEAALNFLVEYTPQLHSYELKHHERLARAVKLLAKGRKPDLPLLDFEEAEEEAPPSDYDQLSRKPTKVTVEPIKQQLLMIEARLNQIDASLDSHKEYIEGGLENHLYRIDTRLDRLEVADIKIKAQSYTDGISVRPQTNGTGWIVEIAAPTGDRISKWFPTQSQARAAATDVRFIPKRMWWDHPHLLGAPDKDDSKT